MPETIPERIIAARAGTNPAVICRLPSGWVVLSDMQFLSGYCILIADPLVPSLNDLDRDAQAQYLCDMALVGRTLMDVTGAYRINYAILGNTDPYLHAHIVPRFSTEPEQYSRGMPWSYPKEVVEGKRFDIERDKELIEQLRLIIQSHL